MRRALAIVGFAFVAVAYACGNFDEADDPPSDGGTPVDAVAEAAADADATSVDGGASVDAQAGPCPRPPGPACAPIGTCVREPLYERPGSAADEFPFGIATDASFVYWVSMYAEDASDDPYNGKGASKIMRTDRSGAAKADVLATGQARTLALAVAGDFVYWTALLDGNAQLRRVRRDCAAPCNAEPLSTLAGGVVFDMLALADDTLLVAYDNGAIDRIHITNALVSPSNLTNVGSYAVISATSNGAFVSGAFLPTVLRATIDGALSEVGKVPDAGDSGLYPGFAPLTNDCNFVYGGRDHGAIWKMSIDGGIASPHASLAGVPVYSLASDRTFVYAGATNGFGLYAIDIATGEFGVVAPNVNIHRIAVDEQGVYWGDHARTTGGSLWMMRK